MTKRESPPKPRPRKWTVLALAATPLLSALGYFAILFSARGDYLIHPHGGVLRLSMERGPRYVVDNFWRKDPGWYWSAPGGIHFRAVEGSTSRGPITTDLALDGATMRSLEVPGGPTLAETNGVAMERFAPGALAAAWQAIHDRDRIRLEQAARRLTETHPRALAPRYWLVSSLCLNGKPDQAEILLEKWRPEFATTAHPWGATLLRWMENDIEATKPEEQAAWVEYNWAKAHASVSPLPLDEFIEWIASRRDTTPPRVNSLAWETTEFAPTHAARGIAINAARFLAMSGEREKAVDVLLGAHVAAWPLALSSGEMRVYMGMYSQREIAEALGSILVAGDATEEEVDRAWSAMEELYARVPPAGSPGRVAALPNRQSTFDADRESFHRGLALWQAYWMVAREAIRVRRYRMATGEWPKFDADHRPIGLPLKPVAPLFDPYDPDGGGLRGSINAKGEYEIRSVGPDGVDDGGRFALDPRAGLSSKGDILRVVEASPRYRFPSAPGHVYRDLKEFRARYPLGLPLDPFRSDETSYEFTTVGGPKVWTHGPDYSYFAVSSGLRTNEPDVPYDPTNGFNSDGDLWLRIPVANLE